LPFGPILGDRLLRIALGPHRPDEGATAGDCQDGKEQTVRVKSKGKVDWYVVSECGSYDGQVVRIQFVDANGNEISPPTPDGKCLKCSDKIKNNGFVKLSLDAKAVGTQPEEYQYVVWVGTTKLSDPKLEIDPY